MYPLLFLKQPVCIVFFRLEVKAGTFSKQQNKTSDTDKHEVSFFAHVSQVNMNNMIRIFEQRSDL